MNLSGVSPLARGFPVSLLTQALGVQILLGYGASLTGGGNVIILTGLGFEHMLQQRNRRLAWRP